MTHDLFKNVLESVNLEIERVEVCDLRDNTYYALIHFRQGDKVLSMDARPSDALALSLRTKAPIYVADHVIKSSSQVAVQAEPQDKSEKGKRWQEILESLNPEDFGKYKM